MFFCWANWKGVNWKFIWCHEVVWSSNLCLTLFVRPFKCTLAKSPFLFVTEGDVNFWGINERLKAVVWCHKELHLGYFGGLYSPLSFLSFFVAMAIIINFVIFFRLERFAFYSKNYKRNLLKILFQTTFSIKQSFVMTEIHLGLTTTWLYISENLMDPMTIPKTHWSILKHS